MNSTKADPVTIELIRRTHAERRDEIRARLAEFAAVWKYGTDDDLWEEMVFCFFTGGCSARMGLNSLESVKPLLKNGSREAITKALVGKHRYPNARSRYVVESRSFLKSHCGMRLREALLSFGSDLARRDWLAKEKGIKGLGYKEASHFLRNIGFRGFGILDKHVLNCLAELGVISDAKPPNNRTRYLDIEQRLFEFSRKIGIDPDEMDLVLWSIKTGQILK